VASFLGLPLVTSRLEEANTQTMLVRDAAQFLAHSDVGSGLSLTQRTRLASQCSIREFQPDELVARANEPGSELFVVKDGTLNVWSAPETMSMDQSSSPGNSQLLASMLPGQITGELALLDGGRRSAELRAGPEGATVLVLRRNQLVALLDDDPTLGNRLIWNIAAALALRLRLTNWQLNQVIHARDRGDERTSSSYVQQIG
jgi:CRP-like cAMP-binding protein